MRVSDLKWERNPQDLATFARAKVMCGQGADYLISRGDNNTFLLQVNEIYVDPWNGLQTMTYWLDGPLAFASFLENKFQPQS